MADVVDRIRLLNYPGLFVEIVIPIAIMLTDWPIHILRAGNHAPFHRQSRWLGILFRLMLIACGQRVSHHPIKFGKASRISRRLFVAAYTFLGRKCA